MSAHHIQAVWRDTETEERAICGVTDLPLAPYADAEVCPACVNGLLLAWGSVVRKMRWFDAVVSRIDDETEVVLSRVDGRLAARAQHIDTEEPGDDD